MFNTPTTISDLIGRWPTIQAFADDIEVGLEAASAMKKRNRIASHHWTRVMSAAENRGIPGITFGWFAARSVRLRRAA